MPARVGVADAFRERSPAIMSAAQSTAQQPAQPQKPKSRLGRGLSSLISVSELPVEVELQGEQPARDAASGGVSTNISSSPTEIPIDQISPNPHQPRRQFNEPALAELAASLKSNGLI